MEEKNTNYFKTLKSLCIKDKIEERDGTNNKKLSYLSWSDAVELFQEHCNDFQYNVKFFDGKPYIYDENLGYMVFTEITAFGQTRLMWLSVFDSKNKIMKNKSYTYKTKYDEKTVEAATMNDINKTIMRCLVKNMAMFGLGIQLYTGEDLPTKDNNKEDVKENTEQQQQKPQTFSNEFTNFAKQIETADLTELNNIAKNIKDDEILKEYEKDKLRAFFLTKKKELETKISEQNELNKQ